MPLVRSYQCSTCAKRLTVHDGQEIPLCCAAPMRWKQTRDYKPEEHGWETGMRAPAIDFRNTTPWEVPIGVDGSHVSSLREIRKLERESEKLERDGVGEAIRFRAFSQDRSNMLQNTFGEPPHARKPQLYDKQGRQKISFDLIDGEPTEVEMGPGADESLASALPMNDPLVSE